MHTPSGNSAMDADILPPRCLRSKCVRVMRKLAFRERRINSEAQNRSKVQILGHAPSTGELRGIQPSGVQPIPKHCTVYFVLGARATFQRSSNASLLRNRLIGEVRWWPLIICRLTSALSSFSVSRVFVQLNEGGKLECGRKRYMSLTLSRHTLESQEPILFDFNEINVL